MNSTSNKDKDINTITLRNTIELQNTESSSNKVFPILDTQSTVILRSTINLPNTEAKIERINLSLESTSPQKKFLSPKKESQTTIKTFTSRSFKNVTNSPLKVNSGNL